MPNRMRVKTTLAPGKRHLDRTNPLALPSIAEMIEEGMTRAKERSSPPLSWFQALDQFLVTQTSGRYQVREGSASADPLKEVTSRT